MNSQNTSLNAMNATVGGRVTRVEVIRDGKSTVHEMNDHNVITDAGMQFILACPCGLSSGSCSQARYVLNDYNGDSIAGGLYFAQFGSGTTAATQQDTSMESMVIETTNGYTDGVAGSTKGMKVYIEGNYYTEETIRTHQFTATSAFSLSEIGYFGKLGSTTKTMFAHIILSEPVSVAVGDVVRVSYNLRCKCASTISTGTLSSYKFQSRVAVPNGMSYDTWNDNTNYGMLDTDRSNQVQTPENKQLCGYVEFSYNYYTPFAFNTNSTSFAVDSSNRPAYFKLSNYWGFGNHFTGSIGTWSIGQDYSEFSLIFDDTIVANFYYIRIKGWDFRFGYYDTDGTTWIDQPIVKDATHRLTLTFRTTVTRE